MLKKLYSILLVLLLWEIAALAGVIDTRFFPGPVNIFRAMTFEMIDPLLWRDIFISLTRLLAGLAAGGIPAVILGICMARSKRAREFFYPLIIALYPIPKIAVLPLIILLFGFGEASKIFIIAAGTFFLMALNTLFGASNIEKKYFDIAKTLRLSKRDLLTKILLPGTLPSIFHGIKLSLGTGFTLLIAAEFISSHSGIGHRIWTAWEGFRIESLYSGLFIIAFLSLSIQKITEKIEKVVLPWTTIK